MRSNIFYLAIFSMCFCMKTKAQILTPIKWGFAAKRMNDHRAVLFIKAEIDEGWHIYSVNQRDGGPVKTSFRFKKANNYNLLGKVSEPVPITKFEKSFQMNVHYFEKEVIFQQKVHLKKNQIVVMGNLEYMACNDEKCLPPETIDFNIPVK
jgi:hypothetical protein